MAISSNEREVHFIIWSFSIEDSKTFCSICGREGGRRERERERRRKERERERLNHGLSF